MSAKHNSEAMDSNLAIEHGLSSQVAHRRLKLEGLNLLPATGQRTLQHIIWDVVREPMFLLLVAAGIIYLLLGDVNDALMLLGFVIVVMGITVFRRIKPSVCWMRCVISPALAP